MLIRQGPKGLWMLLVAAGGLLLSTFAPAADEDSTGDLPLKPAADAWQLSEPDTSDWSCSDCPFAYGWNASLDLGAGYVSDESPAFGSYRGLEDEGIFPVLGARADYRDENGDYLELNADELGLDSRTLDFEWGRQGEYGFRLDYSELPRYPRTGDAQTVFSGAGSANPVLPPGWARAGSTRNMTRLENSLREYNAGYDRQSIGLGFDLLRDDRWEFNLDFRQDTREGDWMRGGSFLFNAMQLPEPVDYKTQRFDASVAYRRERWQLEAGYHLSLFTNEHDALVWDNPFTSSNGADQGRLALEPDNQFHRMMLSGSWHSTETVTMTGRVALGRMEQDEDFLPATINSGLSVPPLPGESLDGEVDTRKADVRVTAQPSRRVTAKLEFDYDERDNNTPRNTYTQVTTDEMVTATRTNRPYSFEERETELTLDYRLSRDLKLSGGSANQDTERSFQQVEKTETYTHWLEARSNPVAPLDLRLRQTREERVGSHEPLGLTPPEHPGMRKFHLADRERDATRLRVNYSPTHKVTLGLSSRQAEDDYHESEAGLTHARDRSHSLDLSFVPAEGMTANAFFSLQTTQADIQGNDNLNGAAWQGEQDDRYRTLGLGLQINDLPGRFTEGGVDWTWATGTTNVSVDKIGVNAPPLPDLESRLYTLNLHAERTLFDNAELRLEYLLEGFREDDYQRDNVNPDTVPAMLSFGADSPDYEIHVVRASFRYRF